MELCITEDDCIWLIDEIPLAKIPDDPIEFEIEDGGYYILVSTDFTLDQGDTTG